MTLIFWGIMDVVHILWYILSSIQRGSVPYYTDMISTTTILQSYGGDIVTYVLISLFWALHFSIMLSAVMLLIGHPLARLICYVQIPFRVLGSTPSISLILIALGFFDGYGLSLAIGLFLISEIVKVFTLWRSADVSDRVGPQSVEARS